MVEMTTNNGEIYMEQEEEWEREGLLDPAWEKQQRKVSTLVFIFEFSLPPTAALSFAFRPSKPLGLISNLVEYLLALCLIASN